MFNAFKILLVDDEQGVHEATRMVLRKMKFEGRGLNLLHAHSGTEARTLFAANPDIAVAVVDVVMESERAGLDFVRHVRDEVGNKLCRIILRTGQPGSAPEREVVQHLEIDDYKEKTELTADRLFTAIYTALRAYRTLYALQRTSEGLERILNAAGHLFGRMGLHDFMQGTLEQLVALVSFDADGLMLRGALAARKSGLRLSMVVGTGTFAKREGEAVEELLPPNVLDYIRSDRGDPHLEQFEEGVVLTIAPREQDRYVFWIPLAAPLSTEATALLRLFAQKLALSLDNALLQQEIISAQEDILGRLCEVIESRSNETGKHVRRMARYSRLLAQLLGLPRNEVETITAAAPLHDIGKISIPDAILQKPSTLSALETEVMRTHAALGNFVLKGSGLSVVQAGAEIAWSHHENWDGSGYPRGLKGEEIPLFGRIVALADVFDALLSHRVYKAPFSVEETVAKIREDSGRKFDPKLVGLLTDNLDQFLAIHEELSDLQH